MPPTRADAAEGQATTPSSRTIVPLPKVRAVDLRGMGYDSAQATAALAVCFDDLAHPLGDESDDATDVEEEALEADENEDNGKEHADEDEEDDDADALDYLFVSLDVDVEPEIPEHVVRLAMQGTPTRPTAALYYDPRKVGHPRVHPSPGSTPEELPAFVVHLDRGTAEAVPIVLAPLSWDRPAEGSGTALPDAFDALASIAVARAVAADCEMVDTDQVLKYVVMSAGAFAFPHDDVGVDLSCRRRGVATIAARRARTTGDRYQCGIAVQAIAADLKDTATHMWGTVTEHDCALWWPHQKDADADADDSDWGCRVFIGCGSFVVVDTANVVLPAAISTVCARWVRHGSAADILFGAATYDPDDVVQMLHHVAPVAFPQGPRTKDPADTLALLAAFADALEVAASTDADTGADEAPSPAPLPLLLRMLRDDFGIRFASDADIVRACGLLSTLLRSWVQYAAADAPATTAKYNASVGQTGDALSLAFVKQYGCVARIAPRAVAGGVGVAVQVAWPSAWDRTPVIDPDTAKVVPATRSQKIEWTTVGGSSRPLTVEALHLQVEACAMGMFTNSAAGTDACRFLPATLLEALRRALVTRDDQAAAAEVDGATLEGSVATNDKDSTWGCARAAVHLAAVAALPVADAGALAEERIIHWLLDAFQTVVFAVGLRILVNQDVLDTPVDRIRQVARARRVLAEDLRGLLVAADSLFPKAPSSAGCPFSMGTPELGTGVGLPATFAADAQEAVERFMAQLSSEVDAAATNHATRCAFDNDDKASVKVPLDIAVGGITASPVATQAGNRPPPFGRGASAPAAPSDDCIPTPAPISPDPGRQGSLFISARPVAAALSLSPDLALDHCLAAAADALSARGDEGRFKNVYIHLGLDRLGELVRHAAGTVSTSGFGSRPSAFGGVAAASNAEDGGTWQGLDVALPKAPELKSLAHLLRWADVCIAHHHAKCVSATGAVPVHEALRRVRLSVLNWEDASVLIASVRPGVARVFALVHEYISDQHGVGAAAANTGGSGDFVVDAGPHGTLEGNRQLIDACSSVYDDDVQRFIAEQHRVAANAAADIATVAAENHTELNEARARKAGLLADRDVWLASAFVIRHGSPVMYATRSADGNAGSWYTIEELRTAHRVGAPEKRRLDSFAQRINAEDEVIRRCETATTPPVEVKLPRDAGEQRHCATWRAVWTDTTRPVSSALRGLLQAVYRLESAGDLWQTERVTNGCDSRVIPAAGFCLVHARNRVPSMRLEDCLTCSAGDLQVWDSGLRYYVVTPGGPGGFSGQQSFGTVGCDQQPAPIGWLGNDVPWWARPALSANQIDQATETNRPAADKSPPGRPPCFASEAPFTEFATICTNGIPVELATAIRAVCSQQFQHRALGNVTQSPGNAVLHQVLLFVAGRQRNRHYGALSREGIDDFRRHVVATLANAGADAAPSMAVLSLVLGALAPDLSVPNPDAVADESRLILGARCDAIAVDLIQQLRHLEDANNRAGCNAVLDQLYVVCACGIACFGPTRADRFALEGPFEQAPALLSLIVLKRAVLTMKPPERFQTQPTVLAFAAAGEDALRRTRKALMAMLCQGGVGAGGRVSQAHVGVLQQPLQHFCALTRMQAPQGTWRTPTAREPSRFSLCVDGDALPRVVLATVDLASGDVTVGGRAPVAPPKALFEQDERVRVLFGSHTSAMLYLRFHEDAINGSLITCTDLRPKLPDPLTQGLATFEFLIKTGGQLVLRLVENADGAEATLELADASDLTCPRSLKQGRSLWRMTRGAPAGVSVSVLMPASLADWRAKGPIAACFVAEMAAAGTASSPRPAAGFLLPHSKALKLTLSDIIDYISDQVDRPVPGIIDNVTGHPTAEGDANGATPFPTFVQTSTLPRHRCDTETCAVRSLVGSTLGLLEPDATDWMVTRRLRDDASTEQANPYCDRAWVTHVELPRYNLSFRMTPHMSKAAGGACVLESLDYKGYAAVPGPHSATIPQLRDVLPGLSTYLALAPISAIDKVTGAVDSIASVKLLLPDRQEKESVVAVYSGGGGHVLHAVNAQSHKVGVVPVPFHGTLCTPQPATAGGRLHVANVLAARGTGTPLRLWGMTGAEAALMMLRSAAQNTPLNANEAGRLRWLGHTVRCDPVLRLVVAYQAAMADPHFSRGGASLPPSTDTNVLCDVLAAEGRYGFGSAGGSRLALTRDEAEWAAADAAHPAQPAVQPEQLTASRAWYLRAHTVPASTPLHPRASESCAPEVMDVLERFEDLGPDVVSHTTDAESHSNCAKALEVLEHELAATPEANAAIFARRQIAALAESCDIDAQRGRHDVAGGVDAAAAAVRVVLASARGAADSCMKALQHSQDHLKNTDWQYRWAATVGGWVSERLTALDAVRFVLEPAHVDRFFPPGFCNDAYRETARGHAQAFLEARVIEASCRRILGFLPDDRSTPLSNHRVREIHRELSSPRRAIRSRYPHFVAFEYINDVRIREQQFELADAMLERVAPFGREPEEHHDCTVAQLNMGEGKTQIVIPLIAIHCAFHRRLPFVHVPIAMLNETRTRLAATLGGLPGLHTAVLELPFDRSTIIDAEDLPESVARLTQLHSTSTRALAQHGRGLVLVAREHVQSRLLKPEGATIKHAGTAEPGAARDAYARLLSFAGLLGVPVDRHVNIFDEADHAFAVDEQLVYAMGDVNRDPAATEERKAVLSTLLRIVIENLQQLRADGAIVAVGPDARASPHVKQSASVPRGFRLTGLNDSARKRIAEEFYDRVTSSTAASAGGATGVCASVSAISREDFVALACSADVDARDTTTDRVAHLVRGLLAHGVLEHCTRQRNRVNYGLVRAADNDSAPPAATVANGGHQKLVAIPYECADVPRARSEFEHIDCAWLLTYLAYLQDGLSLREMDVAVDALKKCELGEQNYWYDRWRGDLDNDAARARIPVTFAAFDDASILQRAELFAVARFAFAVVDFFISEVVLPREGYVFPHSLTATAAHLAALPNSCGFSGTVDNAATWPKGAVQMATPPPAIGATDGHMLDLLLRGACVVPTSFACWDPVANAIDAGHHALIDLGGLIVGVDRRARARDTWLPRLLAKLPREAAQPPLHGVTYFDAADACWMTVSGDGSVREPAHQARVAVKDTFVVYDQAHTRGADHRLRPDASAAMTVGPVTPKDALMQAAARMRGLGYGQTLQVWVDSNSDAMRAMVELADGITVTSQDQRINDLSLLLIWTTFNAARHTAKFMSLLLQQQLHFAATEAAKAHRTAAHLDTVNVDPQDMYGGAAATVELAAYSTYSAATFASMHNVPAEVATSISDFIADRAADLTYVTSNAALDNQTEREVEQQVQSQQRRHVETPRVDHRRDEATDLTVLGYVSNFDIAFRRAEATEEALMVPCLGLLRGTAEFLATVSVTRADGNADYPRRICAAAVRRPAHAGPLEILLLSHHEYALAAAHVDTTSQRTADQLAKASVTPEDGTVICSVAGLEALFFCGRREDAADPVVSALLMDGHVFRGADSDDNDRHLTLIPPLTQTLESLVCRANRNNEITPGARRFVPAPYQRHDLAGAYKGSVVDRMVVALLAASVAAAATPWA